MFFYDLYSYPIWSFLHPLVTHLSYIVCLFGIQGRFISPSAIPPRPATPPVTTNGEDWQSFFRIRPDISNKKDKFSCAYRKLSNGRCQATIKDRNRAYNAWRMLLCSNPAEREFRQLLSEYVNSVSCKAHNDDFKVKLLVERWSIQLEKFYSDHWAVLSLEAPYTVLGFLSQNSTVLEPAVSPGSFPKLFQVELCRRHELYGCQVFCGAGAFPVSCDEYDKAINICEESLHQKLEAVPLDIQAELFRFSRLNIEPLREPTPPPKNRRPRSDESHRIVPFDPTPENALDEAIMQPLTERVAKWGKIYILTQDRDADPWYVKIGVTTGSTTNRKYTWDSHCNQPVILQYSSPTIPNAMRVEKLITLDLQRAGKRLKEENCEGCHQDHIELFSITVDEAISVAEYWCNWMTVFNPYIMQEGTNCGCLSIHALRDSRLGDFRDPEKRHFLTDSAGRPWAERASQRSEPALAVTSNSDDEIGDQSLDENRQTDVDSKSICSNADFEDSDVQTRRPSNSFASTKGKDKTPSKPARKNLQLPKRSPLVRPMIDDELDNPHEPTGMRPRPRTPSISTPIRRKASQQRPPLERGTASAPSKLEKQRLAAINQANGLHPPSSQGIVRRTQSVRRARSGQLQPNQSTHTKIPARPKIAEKARSVSSQHRRQRSPVPALSDEDEDTRPVRRPTKVRRVLSKTIIGKRPHRDMTESSDCSDRGPSSDELEDTEPFVEEPRERERSSRRGSSLRNVRPLSEERSRRT